jgi:hypothetical protein
VFAPPAPPQFPEAPCQQPRSTMQFPWPPHTLLAWPLCLWPLVLSYRPFYPPYPYPYPFYPYPLTRTLLPTPLTLTNPPYPYPCYPFYPLTLSTPLSLSTSTNPCSISISIFFIQHFLAHFTLPPLGIEPGSLRSKPESLTTEPWG